MTPDLQAVVQSGVERLIATTRAVVAITALLIVWLDPSQPASAAHIPYAALGVYSLYAMALLSVAQQTYRLPRGGRVIIHAFDLVAFACFSALTTSFLSPLFLYYTFALMGAMLLWQRRGMLWTAGAALITFVGSGVYKITVLPSADFGLEHLIIGATYIASLAWWLGYVATYGQMVNNTLAKLAERPPVIVHNRRTLVHNVLARAADILQAPRVLMVWEELEEPWMYVALWSDNKLSWSYEPPTVFEDIVAAPLVNASFLCLDAQASTPKVLYTSPTGISHWHGMPLNPTLQKQLAVDVVLSSRLRGVVFEGRIFFLDKPGVTLDDLVVGDYVAHQVAADLDQTLIAERRQQTVIAEAHQHLVRNLHDGTLQSLAGIALQLAETHRLLEENPSAAREHVLEVQRLIAEVQRELRFLVGNLKSASYEAIEPDFCLATRLESVRRQIQRQWGLRVDLDMAFPDAPMPAALAYEIYYIVHEALVNAARHARASSVSVAVNRFDDHVRITVADDGHGFPFHGHYDFAALTALKLGPMMLRERIAALGGSLVLDSSASGACIDIIVPLVAYEHSETKVSSMCG
jgi:signal transduction histidine kinase